MYSCRCSSPLAENWVDSESHECRCHGSHALWVFKWLVQLECRDLHSLMLFRHIDNWYVLRSVLQIPKWIFREFHAFSPWCPFVQLNNSPDWGLVRLALCSGRLEVSRLMAVGQQYEYRIPLEGQHGNWDFRVWNVWNWKEDDSIWLKSEEFWMRWFDEFSGTLHYPGLILVMLLPCSCRRSSPMNIEKRWRGVPTGLWMMT